MKKEKVGSIIRNKSFSNEIIEEFVNEELLKACFITKYSQEQKAKLITNKHLAEKL